MDAGKNKPREDRINRGTIPNLNSKFSNLKFKFSLLGKYVTSDASLLTYAGS
jgi:hypothetical protein